MRYFDEVTQSFDRMEQSFGEMKESFDQFGQQFDEFHKDMSEGLDRIENSFSRMFKWTVILLICMTVILGILIWFGF